MAYPCRMSWVARWSQTRRWQLRWGRAGLRKASAYGSPATQSMAG